MLDRPVDLTNKIQQSNTNREKNSIYLVNLFHQYHLEVRVNQDLQEIRMVISVVNTRKEKTNLHPVRPGRPLVPGGPTKKNMHVLYLKRSIRFAYRMFLHQGDLFHHYHPSRQGYLMQSKIITKFNTLSKYYQLDQVLQEGQGDLRRMSKKIFSSVCSRESMTYHQNLDHPFLHRRFHP